MAVRLWRLRSWHGYSSMHGAAGRGGGGGRAPPARPEDLSGAVSRPHETDSLDSNNF